MHLGDIVKFKEYGNDEHYENNPSRSIFRFNYNVYSVFSGKIFSVIEVTKDIISQTDVVPDNFFKVLDNSWKDFNDSLFTKIDFIMSSHEIQFSNNLYLGTKYFLGYSTGKSKSEFYNYGMKASHTYLYFSLELVFCSRWFSLRDYINPVIYSYETFDFTLNKRINWTNRKTEYFENQSIDGKKLSIIFGISNSILLGMWKNDLLNLF